MRYSELIQKAFATAWKYKYLWVLGLFADLTGYFALVKKWREGTSGMRWSRLGNWDNLHNWHDLRDLAGWDHAGWFTGLSILLIFLVLMVIVALIIIERMSEGGLIANAGLIRRGEKHTLSTAWQQGARFFLRMMGVLIIHIVLIFIYVILFAGFMIVVGVGIGGPVLLLSLIFVIPLFFIGIFFISIVFSYAERFAIIENRGVIDALGSALTLLKCELGKSVIMGLIAAAILLCFTFAVIILFVLLAIPLVALWLASPALAILFGLLFVLPPALFITAYLGAYRSLLWSFFFLELREPAAANPSAPPAPITE